MSERKRASAGAPATSTTSPVTPSETAPIRLRRLAEECREVAGHEPAEPNRKLRQVAYVLEAAADVIERFQEGRP